MPRKPRKQRNPIRGARLPGDHEIGDEVFFSFAGAGGEGLLIGQLRVDQSTLVLAISEGQVIEMPPAYYSPAGHIDPQLGHSIRREYLKRFPGNLRT